MTREFDGISYGYCIRAYDILSIPGRLNQSQLSQAELQFPNFHDWKLTEIKDKMTYVQMSCLCENLYEISITGIIQEQGGLIRYPISYENGWEYYTIMAFDGSVSARILQTLSSIENDDIEVEILSNANVGLDGLFRSQMISGPELFEELTSRQLEILIKAIEMGYYEIPRTVRTKDLATQEGVQRYSIDKLIRTAENKIIKKLTPYLYFKQYLDGN